VAVIPRAGQELWLAYAEHRRAGLEHAIVVTKVARKWATFRSASDTRENPLLDRFDYTNERWPVDGHGYTSEARVWPTRDAWQAELARDRAFAALSRVLHYGTLSVDVTAEDVRACARLLRKVTDFERELTR